MESSIDSDDLVQYAFNFGSFLCITHFTFVLGYQLLLYQMSGLQHKHVKSFTTDHAWSIACESLSDY